jgi:hypothetical protein
MIFPYFINVLVLLFALFALVLSAIPKDTDPAPETKPPPAIEVPAPKPVTGPAGNNGADETPDEKESDLVEKLADVYG